MDTKRLKTNWIHGLYAAQKSMASRRGIEWHFTRPEWIDWWELHLGSSWYRKRGRTKYKYCMARRNDQGPYASWNVECVTNSQNIKDRGPTRAKLTTKEVELVLDLRGGSAKQVAIKFGISRDTVCDIWAGRTWK